MNSISKLKHTIDALFGTGVSKYLPKDIDILFSHRTGPVSYTHLTLPTKA